MKALHLSDHFPLAMGLNACRGKRDGHACAPRCLGHYYSASSAADENQLLLTLPLLPNVQEIVSGDSMFESELGQVRFWLYETGSVFSDADFKTANVFALVVRDHRYGDLIVCLLPSVAACLAELARILDDLAPARRPRPALVGQQ